MKRDSELTFKDICDTNFAGFVKVVWNGRVIFEDADDGLYIEGKLVRLLKKNYADDDNRPYEFAIIAIKDFEEKYGPKKVYNFYCRVVSFHHTELYIEGEK